MATTIMSTPSTSTTTSTSLSTSNNRSSPLPDHHHHNGTPHNDCLTDFIRTGRTGRRNAVADVFIDPNISLTTQSITDLMCKFDCNDSRDQSKKSQAEAN